jgi:hypothetical protein
LSPVVHPITYVTHATPLLYKTIITHNTLYIWKTNSFLKESYMHKINHYNLNTISLLNDFYYTTCVALDNIQVSSRAKPAKFNDAQVKSSQRTTQLTEVALPPNCWTRD